MNTWPFWQGFAVGAAVIGITSAVHMGWAGTAAFLATGITALIILG